jgi:hypothetical protein
MDGKEVTVVDMLAVEEFASEIFVATRNMLFMLLNKHNVKLIGGNKVERIIPAGVEIIDHNWNRERSPVRNVVTAFGMVSNTDGFDELRYLVPETYVLGDCGDGPKSIGNANYTAFHNTVII